MASTSQEAPAKRREFIRCRPLDDQAVLYDVAHHTLHYLNTTALFIWQRCDGTRNAEEIATEMLEAFDIQGDQERKLPTVLKDVRTTMTTLADNGLIDCPDYD